MPKISEEGNEVEILTAILGELERFSTSSSACLGSQLAARWLPVGSLHLVQRRQLIVAQAMQLWSERCVS